MLLLKYVVFHSKKWRFSKEQEASGLLIGSNTPLSGIAILAAIFWRYKMNEIINKFLLAGDKFTAEMHLRQLEFTNSVSGPFSKNKDRRLKLKETGDSRYIYQNKLDKDYFQHDMAYEDFKDLSWRTAVDKACGKAFNLASMFHNFFLIKSLFVVLKVKSCQASK